MNNHPYTGRLATESLTDWHKREYKVCMSLSERAFVLQHQRRGEGYLGAAIFYQRQAARWFERAQAARIRWFQAQTIEAAYDVLRDRTATPAQRVEVKRSLNVIYGKFATGPREYERWPYLVLDGSDHPD